MHKVTAWRESLWPHTADAHAGFLNTALCGGCEPDPKEGSCGDGEQPALWQQKAPAEQLLRTNVLVTDGGVHGTAAIHEPRAASTTTREGMGNQRPLNQLRLLGVADQP